MAKVLAPEQGAELHRQLDEMLDRLPRELKDADKAEQQIFEGIRRLRDASLKALKKSAKLDEKSAKSDDEG